MRSLDIIVGKLGIHLVNAPNIFMLLFTFCVTLYHFKFLSLSLSLFFFFFWETLQVSLWIMYSHSQFRSILLVVVLSDTSHCIVLMYKFQFNLT